MVTDRSAPAARERAAARGLADVEEMQAGGMEAAGTNGAYRAEQEVQYRCIEEYGAGA